MARIFKRYRSGHEVWFAETVTRVMKYRKGLLHRDALERFILRRIRENGLEMDSASFNHLYLEFLTKKFPGARFILTFREFVPWVNSYLHMLLMWRRKMPSTSGIPAWQIDYGRFQFESFDPDDFTSLNNLKSKLVEIVDQFFEYWMASYRQMIRCMDPDRTHIIRTERISKSIDVIADFLKIAPASLSTNESHANRRHGPLKPTEFLNPARLKRYRDLIEDSKVSNFYAKIDT